MTYFLKLARYGIPLVRQGKALQKIGERAGALKILGEKNIYHFARIVYAINQVRSHSPPEPNIAAVTMTTATVLP